MSATLATEVASYSTLELSGIMTLSLIAALLLIALAFRLIQSLRAVREYEAACQKVALIESKLREMEHYIANLERESDKALQQLKEENARERFELQQLVFTRNSEILSLKNTLLELKQPPQYDKTYS